MTSHTTARRPLRWSPCVTRRRALLLGGLLPLALGACDGTGPDPEPSASPASAGTAVPAAIALLADAEKALTRAFGDLEWRDGDPAGCSERDWGSMVRPASRRCDRYLGREAGEDATIARALTEALAQHRLPAAPAPTGGTGGWLMSQAEGSGLQLTFRSKGYAELTVRAFVREGCAQVSDGG